MIYTVLIVDDSSFFQQRLKIMINEHPELNVIGVASNGQEAIELAARLKPDVITMDYEMPLLDGVSAVKSILAQSKVPIIMLSSLTFEGARITIDALAAGAVDFIPKNFSEISQNSTGLKQKIHSTLLSFARQYKFKTTKATVDSVNTSKSPVSRQVANKNNPVSASLFNSSLTAQSNGVESVAQPIKNTADALPRMAKIVVIGASTGGPVALHKVLDVLPSDFPLPIVVIQHMPANFTKALAERLNRVCALSVKEAENGDTLQPGHVLVAPGGQQLMFDPHNKHSIKIFIGDDRVSYKPSVDIAFASLANSFGAEAFGIVLTGMGADGCEGAKILKQKGGVLWSQNQDSCVVYGMPKAVAEAGLSDCVLTLEAMGAALKKRR